MENTILTKIKLNVMWVVYNIEYKIVTSIFANEQIKQDEYCVIFRMFIDVKYNKNIKDINIFKKNSHRLNMMMDINKIFKLVYPQYNDFFVKLLEVCALKNVKEMTIGDQSDFETFLNNYKTLADETDDPFLLYIMGDLFSINKDDTRIVYDDLVTTLEKYKTNKDVEHKPHYDELKQPLENI